MMARNIEAPVTIKEDGPMSESKTIHPAFAQIGANRVSGHTHLYDSDFTHSHYMTITIRRSQLHRNLSRDWHFGKEELIEIAMSEQQWATFVSAPNMGSGVPCTLQHFNGEMIPQLPPPESRTKQFGGDIEKTMAESIEALDSLMEAIGNVGMSARKASELSRMVTAAKQKITSSAPFVANQFDEHMEGTVEKAKAEVHGYISNAINRAGIVALTGTSPVLEIEYAGQPPSD